LRWMYGMWYMALVLMGTLVRIRPWVLTAMIIMYPVAFTFLFAAHHENWNIWIYSEEEMGWA